MTESQMTSDTSRELVGLFSDRTQLKTAIKDLIGRGFERSDISLLASHESVDAAEGEMSLKESLMPLLDEIRYEEPLVNAGLIAMAAGPAGAAIAGLVAAGISGLAVRELLDEASSAPDTERVATALEEGGVMLWVAVGDEESQAKATRTLESHGATDIHMG